MRVIILLTVGCGTRLWVPPSPPKEKLPLLNVLIGLTPVRPVVIPPAPPQEPHGRKIVEFTNSRNVLLKVPVDIIEEVIAWNVLNVYVLKVE